MENNTNLNKDVEKKSVASEQKISTSAAIIVAGVLVMVSILITNGSGGNMSSTSKGPKTLSEQVGVSKDALNACIKSTDLETLSANIDASVEKAMKNYQPQERGTPYSVVIGKDGVKTDVRGAEPYEVMEKIVSDALIGKVSTAYVGDIALSEPTDHTKGSDNAIVTVIEYSDFACPFCKTFHVTMEKIVKESNGNVRWIYRHYPIKQGSFEKAVASNCVAEIKGNDAFWKYSDLLFGLLKTPGDSVSEQL